MNGKLALLSFGLMALIAIAPAGSTATAIAKASDNTCSLAKSVLAGPNDSLKDIAAPDATHVWAVGSRMSKHSLVYRFDGSTWKTERVPDVGRLIAVSASSPTNVWTIGVRGAVHRNGRAWSRVRAPKTDRHGFKHVLAISRRSVWATFRDGGRSVIAHWNGTRWSLRRAQSRADFYSGFSGSSDRNLWIVGSGRDRLFLLHFNGHRWRRTTPPYHGKGSPYFSAIAAPAPRDLWIAGYADLVGPSRIGIIEHWDGSRWAASRGVATPGDMQVAQVETLDALPGGTASAGGYGFDQGGTQVGFALHHAGAGWGAFDPVRLRALTYAVALSPNGTTWAVGADPSDQAFIERFDCRDAG